MDLTSSKRAQPVPKFGSFKPKTAPPPSAESRREEDRPRHRDETSRQRDRHRSHRHRSRSRERHSRHQSRRDKKPLEDDQPKAHRPEVAKPTNEENSDLYVIDRKGDIYNVTYGTIHRYNIPPYRRIGHGGVLGLPSRFKIDRTYNDGGTVLIRTDGWQEDGARHKTRSLLAKTDTRERRIFRMRQDTVSDADAGQDYVPLSSHGSRKRRRILGEPSPSELSDDEADKYGYRSIQGKAKPEQDIPSDMEATSASDSDGEGHAYKWERDIRKKNSDLLRKAEENPTSVEDWLEVIEYQHVLLSGADGRRQLTGAERRSLADIKLSLYDKALKKVGNSEGKDRLLLGYLNEGANLWESKKLREQWNAILKHNPGYIGLWVRYLDFRQSEFVDFTYERCKEIYLDCMKLNASSPDNEEKNAILTYLFLRMTLFMREAGFPEIAIGLWQAVLEVTLFRPAEYTENLQSETLTAFSSFWESEVSRIGEAGAKGWKSGKNADLEMAVAGSKTELLSNSLFSSWCHAETRLNRSARLPARSVDEVENDDPYRVVLWTDVEQFLPFFVNWQDPNLLVERFLAFCYLPPLNSLQSWEASRSSSGDAFLRNEIMHFSDASIAKALESKHEESDQNGPEKLFELPVLQYLIHNADSLFSSQHWFSSLTAWKTATENENPALDAEWVRRALRLLVDASPQDDSLAEHALAVEYAINAKDAKKYAKSLLKKRSSSLRLYNAYAIMECRTGNFSVAAHVWATTLSMSANISEAQKLEYGPLIHSWVWEYMTSKKPAQALGLLISVPTFSVDLKTLADASPRTSFTPAEHLKAVRFFDEFSDHALSVQNLEAFAAWASLAVIFRYLADSFDLSSAIGTHTNACTRITSSSQIPAAHKSFALELLHQHRSRLLYHHITTKQAYKPAAIRELLLESLKLFPHNTAILSLFTWNESRFRIDERIRDVLLSPGMSSSQKSNREVIPITSSLLSIFTELARPIYSGSTVYSARAAFERALSSNNSNTTKEYTDSPSLSLWKLYIYFELHRANNPSAAKRVYYRALRACPWSKDILMLAFNEKLWNGKEFDDWWELKKVYNVLVDKELRIHVEIDDGLFDEAESIAVEREQRRVGRRRRTKGVIDLPDDRSSDGDVDMRR